MPSISQVVRSLIQTKPIVYETLIEGILSHAALAENLQPEIEKELGKEVQLSAIIMAIRRYGETLNEKQSLDKSFKFTSEIIMKTGLADISVVKSPSCISKLRNLHELVDYNRGDTLNVTHGNYEIAIVISDKYLNQAKDILKDEQIINVEQDLVSISVSFSNDFYHTPGILAEVTRLLAWENINAYENISTMTELIFIIKKKDSVRAYKAFERLIDKYPHQQQKNS